MNITLEDYNSYFTRQLYVNTFMLILCLAFGIIGNIAVIFIYIYRMPQTDGRYFIPILAIADLLASVSGSIFGIISNFHWINNRLENFCSLLYFWQRNTTTISAWVLLLIALDRFLKVRCPMEPFNKSRKKWALLFVIVLTITTGLPLLYFVEDGKGGIKHENQLFNVTLCVTKSMEEPMNYVKNFYYTVEFFLPLLNIVLMVVFYSIVGWAIFTSLRRKEENTKNEKNKKQATCKPKFTKSKVCINCANREDEEDLEPVMVFKYYNERPQNNLPDDENNSNKEYGKGDYNCHEPQQVKNTNSNANCLAREFEGKGKHYRRAKYNFSMMFAVVIAFYIISYLPSIILMMLPGNDPFRFWLSMDGLTLNFMVLCKRSYLINHIVNPIIYSFFDLKFRREILKIFSRNKANYTL